MRRKLSVFSMIAGHSLGKLLWILLLLPAANGIMFYYSLEEQYRALYRLLDKPAFTAVFAVAFGAVSVILCGALRDRGGRQNNFLDRLQISYRAIYWNQVFYNTLCYFLLFAVEAMSLLGLAFWNRCLFPESGNHQSLMLDCYQTSILHVFFPLSDWLGWTALILLLLGLGICTAAFPAKQRRGKRSITSFLMCIAALLYVHMQVLSHALFPDGKIIILVSGVLISLVAAGGVLSWEVTEDG